MNGKKAKALRRIAEEVSVGLKDRELGRLRGNPRIVNNPRTTRAVYLDLKRKAREGAQQ